MLQNLWNGLVQGGIYAIVALGYTMVYGILLLINFAHGDVLMLGAYSGVVTLAGCAGSGAMDAMGFVPCLAMALLTATCVAAAYGFTLERAVYRPLRGAPSLSPLIGAIGVSMVLQNYVMNTQGATPIYPPMSHRSYIDTLGGTGWKFGPVKLGVWELGSASVTPLDLVVLILCVALMAGLWMFVQRTRTGTAMRATSQDRVMAGLVGIDVNRVISVTFVIGSSLAAVAGVLLAFYNNQAKYDMGFTPGMKAFTAAVLGGIGNVPGAMLGGVLLGVVEAVGIQLLGAEYKEVYSFVILLAVLIVRPKGILGERVAEKV